MGELRAVAWHEYDPDDLNMSLVSDDGDRPKGTARPLVRQKEQFLTRNEKTAPPDLG